MLIKKPEEFFFASTALRDSIFSDIGFPANFSSSTVTALLGRGGLSLPHTSSTRLVLIGNNPSPPLRFIRSLSAFAFSVNLESRVRRAVGILTCSQKSWVNSYSLSVLCTLACPRHISPSSISRRSISPFLPGWNVWKALLQELPISINLLLCLVEVTSIG